MTQTEVFINVYLEQCDGFLSVCLESQSPVSVCVCFLTCSLSRLTRACETFIIALFSSLKKVFADGAEIQEYFESTVEKFGLLYVKFSAASLRMKSRNSRLK